MSGGGQVTKIMLQLHGSKRSGAGSILVDSTPRITSTNSAHYLAGPIWVKNYRGQITL